MNKSKAITVRTGAPYSKRPWLSIAASVSLIPEKAMGSARLWEVKRMVPNVVAI